MVAATRLDCVLGSAALMRHALAEASWHVAHRSAFGGLLVDKPLMQNVVADLAVESEAATALAMRLASAVDRPGDPHEVALRRIALPLAKFWVCKRTPAMVAEALECLGGNGYVEESGLPLMFRESPLNSIWEGSGNVNALDVLRALGREPEVLQAWITEVGAARGADSRLDRAVDDTLALLGEGAGARGRGAPTGRPDGRLPAGIAARALRARRGRRRLLRQPVRDVVRRHVRDARQRVAARGRRPGDAPALSRAREAVRTRLTASIPRHGSDAVAWPRSRGVVMSAKGSTLFTVGTLLRHAQDAGAPVRLLVQGTWLDGRIVGADGLGVVLDDGNTQQVLVRLDSIVAVSFSRADIDDPGGEAGDEAARSHGRRRRDPIEAGPVGG